MRIAPALALFTACLLCLSPYGMARKKKTEEELTQALSLPKDPPAAVVAQADLLTFHTSTLTAKGLLSAQTRDSLKHLLQQTKGMTIVKLRAFVAGSGDLRRVQTIVSEVFTDKKQPLPALSTVQVGALPLEGAQVIIEAIAVAKKPVNPNGLAFISAQPGTMQDPLTPLSSRLKNAGIDTNSVRRVTCFLNAIEPVATLRTQAASLFPRAALDFVQLQRSSLDNGASCEAVTEAPAKPSKSLQLVGSENGSDSQIAIVAPQAKLAITGTQLAFRQQDGDVRLALGRLGKALESVGANYKQVAFTHFYPLTRGSADRLRRIRFEYLPKDHPPANTMLLFEGLPSNDAAFGVDVIAVL